MINFVQTQYMFPEHAKVFSITARDRLIFSKVADMLKERRDAEFQQEAVQKFVEEVRPELKGCVVFCLTYVVEKLQWQIGVSHSSLPVIPFGCQPEVEPLLTPSWRDQPSQL